MAINVNTVYTTVLSILNKEQRGYLTPYEFNKIATQVQLEIFEKFFEDYNQYVRMPKTDVEFASRMDHIVEEFQIFEKNEKASAVSSNIYTQPIDLHRFGSAVFNKGLNSPPIEVMSNREYNSIKLSPLTQPTTNFPVAKYQQDKLTVFPSVISPDVKDVSFNYIRKPSDVRWGYSLGSLGQYIYDPLSIYSLISNDSLISNITQNTVGATTNSITGTIGVTNGFTSNNKGTGAEIIINIDPLPFGTGLVTNVTVSSNSLGQNFESGDIITVSSSVLGGSSDLVITLEQSNILTNTTTRSKDFEISESQQTEVILKILQYSGIVIRDPQIVQAATQELQQEEVNSKR